MSQENVSRRNFLKIIGGAVVLFGAAIAGLIISSRGPGAVIFRSIDGYTLDR